MLEKIREILERKYQHIFYKEKGDLCMKCMKCGVNAIKSVTTDVTDLGECLIIVRNVPCYKCSECSEVIYTGDIVRKLEKIIADAKKKYSEISVIDYMKYAA